MYLIININLMICSISHELLNEAWWPKMDRSVEVSCASGTDGQNACNIINTLPTNTIQKCCKYIV